MPTFDIPQEIDPHLTGIESDHSRLLSSGQASEIARIAGDNSQGVFLYFAEIASIAARSYGIQYQVDLFPLSTEEVEQWKTSIFQPIDPAIEYTHLLIVSIKFGSSQIRVVAQHRDSLIEVWKWLSLQGESRFFTTARFQFPPNEFECVQPLPVSLKTTEAGFTSVEGVTLVKRRDDDPKSPILYDVTIRLYAALIDVETKFVYTDEGETDMWKRKIDHAGRFTAFAVIARHEPALSTDQ